MSAMEGEFGSRSYFQTADYVVCGLMLLASIAIGVYYGLRGGGQRTSSAYILADRSMTVVPVTLSLLASFFSGISLQGFPADVYYHGPTIIWILIPFMFGGILSLVFYLPMYYRLGMISAYEYLELRFNYAVKICGILSFLIFSVLYSGVVTYMACVAATAVTGIKVEVAVVILCAICAVYTVIGGIKAVLWTDSLQMLLMFTTTIAIVIKGAIEMGFRNVWEIATEGSRTNFFYFNGDLTDFYNGWAFVGQITSASILVTNQYMVQRLVICKTEAVARASIMFYFVGAATFMMLLILGGLTIYAYYVGCDPGTMGYTTKNDQIVPFFIVDIFSDFPGVPGLLLTGLFGAALSTLSSVFNATATVVGEHFVKPYWKGLNDRTYTVTLKLIVVVASAGALGMAFIVPLIGDAVPVIFTISACSSGGLFALYLLGAFCPFCNSKAALTGFVVGMVVSVTLSIGCIVYQTPIDNLPLSAEMCLNETNVYINETSATEMMALLNSSVTEMVTNNSNDDNRSDIPVIFTLSKSWLSSVSCITSMGVAILATLITGKQDTSTMDPRLVFWKIKTSYVQPSEKTMMAATEYSVIPHMECEEIPNNDGMQKSRAEQVYVEKEYLAMEPVDGMCLLK